MLRLPPRSTRTAPLFPSTTLFRSLPAPYWRLVAMAVVLTLPRISEAFLILRAVQLGVSNTAAPWVLVCLSLAYALVAYPAGRLSDRMPRMRMVALGMFVLVMANALLAGADNFGQVLVGDALGCAERSGGNGWCSAVKLRGVGVYYNKI